MANYVQKLESAIVAAHEAGDYEAAQALASELKAWKPAKAEPTVSDMARNFGAGAIRGAGSIGATLLAPVDMVSDAIDGKGLSLESNRQRRKSMDAALSELGADTESGLYTAGKLTGEIAGTAGAGGLVAKGLSAVPMLAKFAPAVQSGGFNLGNAATGSKLVNAGIRAAGGAVQGGASAALVDPESAGTGAAIGAVTPGAIKAAGMVGNGISSGLNAGAERFMRSALKPVKAARDSGDDVVAIRTLLNNGINVTDKGVDKLQRLISTTSDDVDGLINSSGAMVNKQDVIQALDSSTKKFATQATPLNDLETIKGVRDQFDTVWPDQIPVPVAHEVKKGTYRVLNGKFGEQGSAAVEAQKDLARGLKEQIEAAIPGIKDKNATLSDYIRTMDVLSRATGRETNKDILGLALIANGPLAATGMALDRNALVKSLAARGMKNLANSSQMLSLPNFTQQYGLLGAPSVFLTSP